MSNENKSKLPHDKSSKIKGGKSTPTDWHFGYKKVTKNGVQNTEENAAM